MSTKEQGKPAVGKKDFLTFLQGLHLEALRLSHLKVDAEHDFAHGDMKNVEHHEEYGYELSEDGLLRIDAHSQVRLVGPRRKKLGELVVKFSWYYRCEQPMTEQTFKIFAPMVRFQTWPHLREVIQNVATRCNWPRLTLPLLVTQRTGDSQERERKSSEG